MEKEFIPYEQSLALKELGFDEPCFGFYNIKGLFVPDYKVTKLQIDNLKLEECCLAPTFSSAFRWFRKRHSLSTWITSKTVESNTIYIPCGRTIPDTTKKELVVDVVPYAAFKNYEEAELECLKKLIEIAKK